jgi:hypothetical protein
MPAAWCGVPFRTVLRCIPKAGLFNWGAPMVNDLVTPSYMTDLLNTTVACIGLASYPKSSKSSQFSINQQLKAYITEQTDLAQLLIYLIAVDAFH